MKKHDTIDRPLYEIGNRDVRMKAERLRMQGNTGNHGGGVFAAGRKMALEPRMRQNTTDGREKPKTDWEKDL